MEWRTFMCKSQEIKRRKVLRGSMSKKPRKKKNNHQHRCYRMSLAMTKGYGIAKVNNNGAEIVNLDSFERIPSVPMTIVKMMDDVPHWWNVFLIVSCTESNGKVKLICDQIKMADKKLKSDLSEFLSGEYSDLIDDCASKMVINFTGWIATTMADIEPSDIQIEQLMNQLLEVKS